MAVVQISRIQLRRGKKNEGTGMPQLASGEMAWAVDTQELYIGSGSVGEGAPAVENIKVLTEKDSVISIAGLYQYYYDDDARQSSLSGTIRRSIQERLDEGTVNSKSFGIVPDTNEDLTLKIQTAVTSVFSAPNAPKVAIEFDAGEFTFSSTVTLPSHTKIKGQGKDITILHFDDIGNAFITPNNVDGLVFKDLTLKVSRNDTIILTLQNSRNCVFDNVKIVFDDGQLVFPGTPGSNRVGIKFTGANVVSNNGFLNVEFSRLTYAVFNNTGGASYNTFTKCYFNNLYKGLMLGSGSGFSANYNVITDSIFDEILNEGIEVVNGLGNKSISNRFKNVGSSQAGGLSTSSIIKFHTDKNSSIDDFFERQITQQEYGNTNTTNLYLPEVDGVSFYAKNDPTKVTLDYAPPPVAATAMTLPLKNLNGIKIDYVLNSLTYEVYRRGTMHILIDKDTGNIELADEYEVRGEVEDSINFTGAVEIQGSGTVLRIKYLNNPTYLADRYELTYTYSVLS